MASRRSSKSRARGRKKVKTRAAWRDSLSEQLADHRIDAVAILLLVAGVLCLLGILTNLVGPVGHQLDEGSAYFLGHGKLLVPIALLTSAVLLLTEREDEERRVARVSQPRRHGIKRDAQQEKRAVGRFAAHAI